MPATPLPNCSLLSSVTTPGAVPKVTGTISLKSWAGRVYRIGFRYPTGCLPASLASWFASATSAANWGEEALVPRSEEHTSELQSLAYLVCRLLLEKKKKYKYTH